MRLPDFIIGGAPRSGTTWMYHMLDRHPGIAMAKPLKPEPKFFLVDELYRQGLEYYSRRWFAGVPVDQLAGEKSTNYLEGPETAVRIREAIPRVKLIFILRNPIDRAYSNYKWSRMNGMELETFDTALALEAQREREISPTLRYSRPHDYFSRGLYADALSRYLAVFPREQILVLKLEDCVADPTAAAATVHGFLGLQPRPEDGLVELDRNESNEETELSAETRARLAARYAEPNRRLAAMLGWPEKPWKT
jgi:sulfotransferase family protein